VQSAGAVAFVVLVQKVEFLKVQVDVAVDLLAAVLVVDALAARENGLADLRVVVVLEVGLDAGQVAALHGILQFGDVGREFEQLDAGRLESAGGVRDPFEEERCPALAVEVEGGHPLEVHAAQRLLAELLGQTFDLLEVIEHAVFIGQVSVHVPVHTQRVHQLVECFFSFSFSFGFR